MLFENTPIDWPLDSNIIRRQSNSHTFGMVRRNADGSPRPHQGWDFVAMPGTPCYSIADGKVEYISSYGDYGVMAVIRIGNTDKFAAYAHMTILSVSEGDVVKLGQQIGTTGNSGSAASMKGEDQHLHFEIRTKARAGKGLGDRISPLQVFGAIPMKSVAFREALLNG